MKEKAIKIVKRLQDKGFEAVFAGGCVRDMLMDIEPKDYDIATSAEPNIVKKIFPRTFAVGESFGVIIVVDGEDQFEVATFRSDSETTDGRRPDEVKFNTSMKKDAFRRDLTINGIFFDPINNKLFDFVGGKTDIKTKTIRFIGDAGLRIQEDHLRILRTIRFSSKSNAWKMNSNTLSNIEFYNKLLYTVSSERIREELEKILLLSQPSIAFEVMLKLKILDVILPELAILDTIPQSPKWHLEGNTFVHSMLTIDNARLTSDDPIVLWGALFHDLGKGKPIIEENGTLRFYDHDEVGAEITNEVLKRLKFSNKDREIIVNIVADHMRVKNLPKMREAKVRRLMSANHFDKLLLVSEMDSLSSLHENHNTNKRLFVKFAENFKKFLKEEPMMPTPLLTGYDLIEIGKTPGPEFKRVLRLVADKQLEGEITTKAEAIELVNEVELDS